MSTRVDQAGRLYAPAIVTTSLADVDLVTRPRGRVGTLLPVSVFAIGALARIGSMLLSSGGLRGSYDYDPAVYYAAADAFVHGRVPYRDFVLLHPPGVMLAIVPFAVLGNATTDLTGFVAGNLTFALLGAASAALTYRVARRVGMSAGAAWLGGAFYAVWSGAVFVETSSRLEPLGSFALLCGLVALTGGRADRNRRDAVLGGMALGFATSVKIWWIAPLLIIAVWLWRRADRPDMLRPYLIGAAAVFAVVDGPFFALAPRAMARMIVLDQLGRGSSVTLTTRLVTMSTLPTATLHFRGEGAVLVSVGFVLIVAGICALSWRFRPGRIFVVLAVASLVFLLLTPPFFAGYLDFVAAPLAITVAGAAHGRTWGRSARPLIAVVVAGMATITAVGAFANRAIIATPFPTSELAAYRPQARCVTAITPAPLIELNLLSRNLRDGCRQWVDSYGRTYDVDRSGDQLRRDNQKWQADLRRYLLSGGAIVLLRPDKAIGASLLTVLGDDPRITRGFSLQVGAGRRSKSYSIYLVAPVTARAAPRRHP